MRQLRSCADERRATTRKGAGTTIHLRTILLLAGGVRRRGLASRLGRSVLDLPLSRASRLLDAWLQRVAAATDRRSEEAPPPEIRIVVSPSSPVPAVGLGEGGPRLHAERDAGAYRGTAGALRDLCADYEDEDHVLVATASQCPEERQIEFLLEHADPACGVSLLADPAGAPTGLMLVRCRALREIPEVGFVDLKEQALPRIAEEFGVRVVRSGEGASPAIRDLATYVDVLRSWHQLGSLRGARALDPYGERGASSFAIVEAGASVAEGATLHDAVVLAGGSVEHGAEVARSVVGPGAVVRRGEVVLDRVIVGPNGADRSRARGAGS